MQLEGLEQQKVTNEKRCNHLDDLYYDKFARTADFSESYTADENNETMISQQDHRKEARPASGITKTDELLGELRVQSDLRQIGGFLMVLGIGAAYSTLALKSALVDGQQGLNETFEGYRLPLLVSVILQTCSGLFSMAVGFVLLVVTPKPMKGSVFHRVSKVLLVVVNCGFITIILSLLRLCQGAMAGPLTEVSPIIPMSYDPVRGDVYVVAGCGAVAMISVCSTLIGGLTILALNLCAYLGGQPVDKNKAYYMFRYAYYCLLVVLGGLSELALGIYVWCRFGAGPLEESIHVAVYTVNIPQLTIIVGIVQTVLGFYGYGRSMGYHHMGKEEDNTFLQASLITWILTIILQIIVQNAYDSTVDRNSEAATVAAVYLGHFCMPPYLDFLARTTPMKIDPKYFGLHPDTKAGSDVFSKFFGFEKPTISK